MPYEHFEAWQLCQRLVRPTYRITRQFPLEKPDGLTAQCRRASFSAADLVEGSATRGSRGFARFLGISIGALAELSHMLRLARERGYLTPYEEDDIERLREQSGKAIWELSTA